MSETKHEADAESEATAELTEEVADETMEEVVNDTTEEVVNDTPDEATDKTAAEPAAEVKAPGKAKSVATVAAKKRGPGRPPKKTPAPPLISRGIVDSPSDPENRFEFVIGTPEIFKKLFTYYKQLKAQYVTIRFTPDAMTLFARDHTKTSRIVARIGGEHVNWFYCESEFWMSMKRQEVEKMFASIDKSFFKMTILVRHDNPDHMHFILKDAGVGKEGNYKFPASELVDDDELFAAEQEVTPEKIEGKENQFPVQFTLSAKQFKKEISDAVGYTDAITIEKLGTHPLQMTYNKVTVSYAGVYRDPEVIKLYSEVQKGQTFRCTIKVANVKSLASSMVTDDVRILAREEGDILFRSAIDDKALVIGTLTKLA